MAWWTRTPARETWAAAAGAGLLGLLAAGALWGPGLAPFDPVAVPARFQVLSLRPPRAPHHLGTDLLGRDVLSRVVHGTRTTLGVALAAQAAATLAGLLAGVAAARGGPRADRAVRAAVEVVGSVPRLPLALGLLVVLGPAGLAPLALVLAAVGWPPSARAVRHAARVRPGDRPGGRDAARRVGEAALLAALDGLARNMLAETGLSFLGLGAQPPVVSWGGMLAEGQAFLTAAPWIAVFPGVALTLAALAPNLLAEGLRARFAARLAFTSR
jgi:ABC-type dipeptide/oligopeptide/nickel transport system permease subunit